MRGRQTASAKVRRQEGNSPDCLIRSQSQVMSGKGRILTMTTRRWAWKQPSFEDRVLAHWLRENAPKMNRGSIPAPNQQVFCILHKHNIGQHTNEKSL